MKDGSNQPAAPGQATFSPPYPPSWVDHMMGWVERLPLPWWLFYVLLAVVVIGSTALVLWLTGIYARTGFHPMQVWVPFLVAFFLAFIHAMDRIAARALERIRPLFSGSAQDFEMVRYRLTTMPRRAVMLVTFVIVPLLFPAALVEFSYGETGGVDMVPGLFYALVGSFSVSCFVWTYHVIRQLREIHVIYRDYVTVRLENVRPMHAFSRLTAFTAAGIVILTYGWVPAQPGLEPGNPVMIMESTFSTVLALAVFVWPLWGAHRKLAEAKEEAQADLAQRKHATRQQLRHAVDNGDLVRVDPLSKVLAAYEVEANDLGRLATWPWAPGMLRNLVGAVLLPIVLWLVQFGLGRWLR